MRPSLTTICSAYLLWSSIIIPITHAIPDAATIAAAYTQLFQTHRIDRVLSPRTPWTLIGGDGGARRLQRAYKIVAIDVRNLWQTFVGAVDPATEERYTIKVVSRAIVTDASVRDEVAHLEAAAAASAVKGVPQLLEAFECGPFAYLVMRSMPGSETALTHFNRGRQFQGHDQKLKKVFLQMLDILLALQAEHIYFPVLTSEHFVMQTDDQIVLRDFGCSSSLASATPDCPLSVYSAPGEHPVLSKTDKRSVC